MSTMLVDEEGVEVITLGGLLHKCTTLENEVESMCANIHAQGGVVFGTHHYASEEALRSMGMKLHPSASGLAAFSDASSLF